MEYDECSSHTASDADVNTLLSGSRESTRSITGKHDSPSKADANLNASSENVRGTEHEREAKPPASVSVTALAAAATSIEATPFSELQRLDGILAEGGAYCSSPEESDDDDQEDDEYAGGASSQGGFWYGEGGGASALEAAMGQWGEDLDSMASGRDAEGGEEGAGAGIVVATLLRGASGHDLPPHDGGDGIAATERRNRDAEDESWEIVDPPRPWSPAVSRCGQPPVTCLMICFSVNCFFFSSSIMRSMGVS